MLFLLQCLLDGRPRALAISGILKRHLGQTEIQNFGMAALGDEDIRRLDISMDDSLGVRCVECVGDLNRQAQEHLGLQGFAGNEMLQRHAVKKLHGDERLPVLIVDLIDGADVGMVQGRSGLGLTLKAAQSLLVSGDLIGKEFERHKAIEFDILGLVDDPHPATAEFLEDSIVRDDLVDHAAKVYRLWEALF